MAAASAALDRGVPIDVELNTGRWASWQVFNRFYNRARLRDVAPSIGLLSLAYRADWEPAAPSGRRVFGVF